MAQEKSVPAGNWFGDSKVVGFEGQPLVSEKITTNETKRVDGFIPNERMGEFLRKLETIQASARKLDLPEWRVVFGEKEWRPAQAYPQDLYPGRIDHAPLQIEGCSVSIEGEAPVLNGWRFLAKIEHGEGGNLVKRMVGGDSSPTDWHSCGPNCDHCNVSRARNNTYMLQNADSGEVQQVGSTCVTDFIGQEQRDPERIAAMYDYLMDLSHDFEYDPEREIGEGAGVLSCGVAPELLMRVVLKIVQEDGGYLSAEKAEILHCANTGDRLRAVFWSQKPSVVVPDAGHVERASQVVSWLREQKSSDSLWLRNIAYLADRSCITCKDAGLFASGYVAWNRQLQRQLRSENGMCSWVGTVGEKITTAATLERHAGYETAYGFKTVLSFRDEEGNGLVWKTQSPPRGLVVGSTYHLLATVKDHGEYAGDKQTEVIRAKVAELELFSFGTMAAFKKLAAIAKPDVCDESGHTPLLKAVWADQVEYAKVLVAGGSDVNQLNQGEVPILAYAVSTTMAQMLLSAGARATDLSDVLLKEMESAVRDVVVRAMPITCHSLGDPDGLAPVASVTALASGTVADGFHCGRVMAIENGLVTQKINRAGETVQHDARKLSLTVKVGDVVDIQYRGGQGVVGSDGRAAEIGR